MTSISKFVALAVFAAGAATISFAPPSQAQAGRPAVIAPDAAVRPDCCELATKAFSTGSAGWTVKFPNAQATPAAFVTPKHQLWDLIPGSKWIGPSATASASAPAGVYIYTYHLGCLCDVPKGIQSVPASLSLRVLADDAIVVKLNNFPIFTKTTGWSFRNGPPAPPADAAPIGGFPVNVTSAHFNTGCEDNVLTFEVTNGLTGPTGLDVLGTMSGYFHQPSPGKPCPCGPRDPRGNSN
ncbi:MAG TPA: hypothetical protein VGC72_16500 [Candidatus Elarobacter sp.]